MAAENGTFREGLELGPRHPGVPRKERKWKLRNHRKTT